MNTMITTLCAGKTPFCIIQKQDSEDILILTGETHRSRNIHDIPRKTGPTYSGHAYDTISVVPFCQIRERGYTVHDEGEEILTIVVNDQCEMDAVEFLDKVPMEEVQLNEDITYDSTETEYNRIIRDIVEEEIGNGEGANFVVPRSLTASLADFTVTKGLNIFKSLLENDYGTYWKFIFYDTDRFFIGSTPERHLQVQGGRVKMNPISGTFRKDKTWARRKHFKADLLRFLTDRKEINELFMVVDEELKMMAKMCERGGAIVGPLLKEMSQLIHSEYLLAGESDKDIFDLFIDSMFAATVVGSPVENACNIIARYTPQSRRYYGSAMMLVGRDEKGNDFLDSPITIRTAEIDTAGRMHLSVGATLVKDSIPAQELEETRAKGAGILSSITRTGRKTSPPPVLPRLYNDDEIIETLAQRNQNLSNFWFFRQESSQLDTSAGEALHITIIHNEDDFVFMLKHMLTSMGVAVAIAHYNDYHIDRDTSDITLMGPGPGNPNNLKATKIAKNHAIAKQLLERKKPSLFICLGHQVLCLGLGLEVRRKKHPLQGSQNRIELFGKEELVGFYNTFAPQAPPDPHKLSGTDIAVIPELNELVAIRSNSFIGYQFHPESLLTKNGYEILRQSLEHLRQKV